MQRLLRFVFGVAAVLAGLEVAFRLGEPAIAASGHRVLTKVAILDAQGPVETLFFGSSQSWDAISPRLFSARLEQLQPGLRARGFNLAVTSSTLETLEWLARRYAHRAGLRLAVIEVSEPQLQSGLLPWEEPAQTPRGAEEWIEDFAARHACLVRHRGALRGESLERLPGLLFFAPRLDGSEVLVPEQLAAAWGRTGSLPAALPEVNAVHFPEGEVNAVHMPERAVNAVHMPERAVNAVHMPERAVNAVHMVDGEVNAVHFASAASGTDPRALRLISIASMLREGGASVAFIVPPLQPGMRTGALRTLLPSLARAAPVWDFSAADIPEEMFRDPSHLNHRGRALFSAALAAEASRAGLLGAGLARRE
jgi:hypothetical protein